MTRNTNSSTSQQSHINSTFINFRHMRVGESRTARHSTDRRTAMDSTISIREDLAKAAKRLGSFAALDALVLLKRHSVHHSSSIRYAQPHAADVRRSLKARTTSLPSARRLHRYPWIKVSLLVRNAGLGDRRVSSLVLLSLGLIVPDSVFLTSAAGTRDLQDAILSRCDASTDLAVDNVL